MPSSPNKQPKPAGGRLSSLVVLLVLLAALAWVATNRQSIYDWWQLRNYQAPAAVAQLADQDSMTAYGQKVFYVNHPAIQAKADFSHSCPNNGGEQTIVLGCYKGNNAGVYLLAVSDQRLDGVEQVTAAHEMLHAAYDRLSNDERNRVDAMLQDYYQNGLTDQRIKDTINDYRKTEPNDLVNEMHSIFGSEIAQLPAPLEAYYKQYFSNRGQVAAYAAQYQAAFTSRQAQLDQYKNQLDDLKTEIDSTQADLNTQQAQIDSRQANLNRLKANGNVSGYNAAVPGYNALIDNYNSQVQLYRSLVSQYNQLVATYNALAQEQGQLVNELNASKVTPLNQ